MTAIQSRSGRIQSLNELGLTANLTHGDFLPSNGTTCFSSLDGSDVAAWLTRCGFEVLGFYDTGRNGLAITVEGTAVSTNGYISKATAKQIAAARRSIRNPFAWS